MMTGAMGKSEVACEIVRCVMRRASSHDQWVIITGLSITIATRKSAAAASTYTPAHVVSNSGRASEFEQNILLSQTEFSYLPRRFSLSID